MSIYRHFRLTIWGKFCEETQQSFWAPITSKITWKKVSFTPPPKSSILGPKKSGVYPTFNYRGFDAKIKTVKLNPTLVFLNCHHSDYPTFKMAYFDTRKWSQKKWGQPHFRNRPNATTFWCQILARMFTLDDQESCNNLSKICTWKMTIKQWLSGGWYPLF